MRKIIALHALICLMSASTSCKKRESSSAMRSVKDKFIEIHNTFEKATSITTNNYTLLKPESTWKCTIYSDTRVDEDIMTMKLVRPAPTGKGLFNLVRVDESGEMRNSTTEKIGVVIGLQSGDRKDAISISDVRRGPIDPAEFYEYAESQPGPEPLVYVLVHRIWSHFGGPPQIISEESGSFSRKGVRLESQSAAKSMLPETLRKSLGVNDYRVCTQN